MSVLPLLTSSSFTYYVIQNEDLVKNITFEIALSWAPIWAILLAFGICTTTFTCLAGGFVFGWKVIIIIIPTYILAQSMGYFMAKKIDNELIEVLKSKKKYPSLLENITVNEAKVVFFSRLSPVLPFALINFVLGILKIDFKVFTIAGLLGMLPRTIFCIWIGSQVQSFLHTQNQSMSFWFATITIALSFIALIKILAQKSKSN